MRFLFGIFTGAALTLLVATTADAPTSPVVKQISTLWQQLITGTGELLFRHREDSASAIPGKSVHASSTGAVTTAPDIEPAHSSAAQPLASAPEPQTDYPGTLLPAADNKVSNVTTEQTAAPESETATLAAADLVTEPPPDDPPAEAMVAEATTHVEIPASPSVADVPMHSDQQLAAVWVPFHSERSANGFARSLSRHFAHPFSVQRTGPGAYQVTFAYADPAQREHMLSEIAELTGQ